MMGLPQLIDVDYSTDQATLLLAITPELPAFAGHFDKVAIVPGVVQIHWALAFARLHLPQLPGYEVTQMESIKFKNVITPNVEVKLDLKVSGDKLNFSFSSVGGRHSSGTIVVV